MRSYRNYYEADPSIEDRVKGAKSKVDTGLSAVANNNSGKKVQARPMTAVPDSGTSIH